MITTFTTSRKTNTTKRQSQNSGWKLSFIISYTIALSGNIECTNYYNVTILKLKIHVICLWVRVGVVVTISGLIQHQYNKNIS